jgi:hypothetical protein
VSVPRRVSRVRTAGDLAGTTGRIIDPDMSTSRPDERTLAEEVDLLVDEQRIACLWFLRPDYRPTTTEQRILVLRQIERHGDLAAFRRAATLRRWLSQTSSAASADS